MFPIGNSRILNPLFSSDMPPRVGRESRGFTRRTRCAPCPGASEDEVCVGSSLWSVCVAQGIGVEIYQYRCDSTFTTAYVSLIF